MTATRRDVSEKIARELRRARRRYLSIRSLRSLSAGFTRIANVVRRALRLRQARIGYRSSPLFSEPDTVFLARIVGNELEPRHKKGQSLENVEFILRNEPKFPNCTKYWVLNRIIDPEAQQQLIDLLESHEQEYTIIPFEISAYRAVDWDLACLPCGAFRFTPEYKALEENGRVRAENAVRRRKNLYIMNNNGARNLALSIGRSRAKWVLPWDGNCFLTQQAFEEISAGVGKYAHVPYFVVPMARVEDNQALLRGSLSLNADEEPQIIFRRDAREVFNEAIPYGRRPKVDLLWRLGVPGVWDRYGQDAWDQPRPLLSGDRGLFKWVGWVARLTSGRAELEVGRKSSAQRGAKRDEAIKATIDRVDQSIIEAALDPRGLMFYDDAAIAALAGASDDATKKAIRDQAELALSRGPHSVLDKSAIAPSGDPHDYFHPAPYWWPDPSSRTGLPYVRKDGEQVPETKLYHPQSGKFDRTRLQILFDDTLSLALAWRLFGDVRYAEHGARLIRTWFLDARTRMTPHMLYAQVRAGHDPNRAAGRGIIEFRDVYYFLDAVRLIERSGALAPGEGRALRGWFTSYSAWLDTHPVAVREFQSSNNHGVFFDVQRAAIAAFLGDGAALSRIRLCSRERIHGQIAADGSLPKELARTRPGHYVLFTLQGWTTLARLMSSIGDDLWGYRTADGRGIELALDWVSNAMANGEWPEDTIAEVEMERLAPLMLDLANHYSEAPAHLLNLTPKIVFHPDAGIALYWSLQRR